MKRNHGRTVLLFGGIKIPLLGRTQIYWKVARRRLSEKLEPIAGLQSEMALGIVAWPFVVIADSTGASVGFQCEIIKRLGGSFGRSERSGAPSTPTTALAH